METNLKQAASVLSKLIDDNEKIAIHVFAAKLSKASSQHPEDQTIGVMADITSRMADGKKLFITRAEIRELYNKLYSRNTKFAELFKTELGEIEKPKVKTYNRDYDDNKLDIISNAFNSVVDPLLANALNDAFGNPKTSYVNKYAETAKALCTRACNTTNVDIAAGNENVILCRASFETPKGVVSLFVPIEIAAGKALLPSIFIGNGGKQKFSKTNIDRYVVANAGVKLGISDKVAFTAFETKGNDISNVDLAVIKLNASKETQSELAAHGILFQKIASEDKNLVVNTPKYKDNEIESFAKAFDSDVGIAKFNFGNDKVSLGKTVVLNKLNSMGLDNAQISVFSSDKMQIIYAVSLNSNRISFRVPVKVSNGKLLDPTLLISNGAVESFSKDGIQNLFKKESLDYKAAAVASPLYSLKASELVQTVRDAMIEENYVKAEDALNILASVGDEKAYQTAFGLFTNGLSGSKTAAPCGCKMVVKNASSKHNLCGHTGLPLHKVYTDKNGDCQPLYRRGMTDTKEGAYFMNNKIFF